MRNIKLLKCPLLFLFQCSYQFILSSFLLCILYTNWFIIILQCYFQSLCESFKLETGLYCSSWAPADTRVTSDQLWPLRMSVSGVSPDTGVKRTLDDTEVRSAPSGDNNKKYKQDLASLPTRQYLDQTVVPILLQVHCSYTWYLTYPHIINYQGLASLARERPRDPIEYLAGYLIRHKREYDVDRDKQWDDR